MIAVTQRWKWMNDGRLGMAPPSTMKSNEA
jgi:hypothetical protein